MSSIPTEQKIYEQRELALYHDARLDQHDEQLDRLNKAVFGKIQPHIPSSTSFTESSRIAKITTSPPFAPTLELEDGSSWLLSHIFGWNYKISAWAPNHDIEVSKKPSMFLSGDISHFIYDYDIVNSTRQHCVSASLIKDTDDGKYTAINKPFI